MADRLVGYNARTLEDLVTAKAELEGRLEESRRQVTHLQEDVSALVYILEANGFRVIQGQFRRADGTLGRYAVVPTEATTEPERRSAQSDGGGANA